MTVIIFQRQLKKHILVMRLFLVLDLPVGVAAMPIINRYGETAIFASWCRSERLNNECYVTET